MTVFGRERKRDVPLPTLGQHTAEVLRDFDIGQKRIDSLAQDGVTANA